MATKPSKNMIPAVRSAIMRPLFHCMLLISNACTSSGLSWRAVTCRISLSAPLKRQQDANSASSDKNTTRDIELTKFPF